MRPLTQTDVDNVRKIYTKGSRVKLIHTDDEFTELRSGDVGNVVLVDDYGTVFIDWDTGSRLGMIVGIDDFIIVDRATE